uniref:C-type lectin domain-containing protein n=1 Tax=Oryzias latipes TaxID=8090 RepID=A0A3P9IEX1_ORYLA
MIHQMKFIRHNRFSLITVLTKALVCHSKYRSLNSGLRIGRLPLKTMSSSLELGEFHDWNPPLQQSKQQSQPALLVFISPLNHYTDLASIRNEAENLQIRDMKALADHIWFGLYRGAWRLINGSLPTLRYWKDGQPSSNDEDCAVANFEDQGKWEDWNCTDRRASVCYHSKKSFALSLSF